MILKEDGSIWSTGITTSTGMHRVRKHFTKVIPNGATAAAAGSLHSLVLQVKDWLTHAAF